MTQVIHTTDIYSFYEYQTCTYLSLTDHVSLSRTSTILYKTQTTTCKVFQGTHAVPAKAISVTDRLLAGQIDK